MKSKDQSRRFRRRLKFHVISQYGDRCVCCGEDDIRFLTLDHKNNDGSLHRRKLGSGTAFYCNLKRLGFPKKGLEVACFNCNMGRVGNGGICPHKQKADVNYSILLGSPGARERFIAIDGVSRSLGEWAKINGIGRGAIYERLKRGMSLSDAVSTPRIKSGWGKKP